MRAIYKRSWRLTVPNTSSEEPGWPFAEEYATVDESLAQRRDLADALVQSFEKADPRKQHVRRLAGRPLRQARQSHDLGTLGVELAQKLGEYLLRLRMD